MKRLLSILLALLVVAVSADAQKSEKKRKARTGYTTEECINAFTTRMNANARQFGMVNTTFKNSSGWHAEGHVSSASDMVRLLMAATTYDKLMLYWGWEKYDINVMGDDARTITVKSTYKGTKAKSLGEHYQIIGGKSGSWNLGKKRGGYCRNVASIVKSNNDDRWLAGCVMGAGKDRFVAMRQLMDWLEAKRIDPNTPEPELECKYAAATVIPPYNAMSYRDFNLVMVGKDADTCAAPYSMTKMMTAMVTLDYCKQDEILTIIEDDIMKGSGPKLHAGDRLLMEEALIALMLPSSNTIAKALSRHVGEKILRIQDEATPPARTTKNKKAKRK